MSVTAFDETEINLGKDPQEISVNITSDEKQSDEGVRQRKNTINHSNEKIKETGQKALGYKWMHHQEFLNNMKMNDRMQWWSLVLPIIATLLASVASSNQLSETGTKLFIYFQLVFSFFSALVSGYKEASNFQVQALNHKAASNKFANLHNTIEMYFALEPKQQQDRATHTLEMVTKEINLLLSSDIVISEEILEKYNSKADVNDVSRIEDIEKLNVPQEKTFRVPKVERKKGRAEIERWSRNH